jgi:hypothetical protein
MSQVRETLRMAELDFSSKHSAILRMAEFPITAINGRISHYCHLGEFVVL